MKILHTSDWHIGRSLIGRKRYDEFTAFLDWIIAVINENDIDALLVAGDIFDNTTPSNKAQEIYYAFLCRVAGTCCKNVVITAGNHDSPTFLDAPKGLLKALNVHVVGAVTENLEDEIIKLNNNKGELSAVVCAVPYLRDKDIRTVSAGETYDDKGLKLIDGIRKHYEEVCSYAEKICADNLNIPIIAMGHLFTSGGQTIDGDGVRDLYVGSLAQVKKDMFPPIIDYFALGHLHIPQSVGGAEHIRYSGSPIPMSFGEANQKKQVVVVEFENKKPVINFLEVPCFQALIRIAGGLELIKNKIDDLKSEKSTAWLEIEYQGDDVVGNLREILDGYIEESCLEIRSIKNKNVLNSVISRFSETETLEDLDEYDVFERCMDVSNISVESREELRNSYKEIILSLKENDKNAE